MRFATPWLLALALAAIACQQPESAGESTAPTRADSLRGVYVEHDTTFMDSPLQDDRRH